MNRNALLVTLLFAVAAFAQKTGHPMITPYEGSTLDDQSGSAFAQYPLLTGRTKEGKGVMQPLEGKTTILSYKNPEGRSALEVSRNYENALKTAGFKIGFVCSGGKDCPEECMDDFGCAHESWSRYFVANLSRPREGDVWVALKASDHETHIAVVELRPMETDKVKIDAGALAKGLDADGHIAVYGIVFDSGKAELKPESQEQLKEIAALLKQRPDLKIHVVGHTDNVGELSKNMDLSRRRAEAVVQALVKSYGIAANRLNAAGVASLVPLTTNGTDAGRARNRRVDLVRQ